MLGLTSNIDKEEPSISTIWSIDGSFDLTYINKGSDLDPQSSQLRLSLKDFRLLSILTRLLHFDLTNMNEPNQPTYEQLVKIVQQL